MWRRGVAVVATVGLTATACAGPRGVADFCERVAAGDLVALDAPDAAERWAALRRVAPDDLVDDVTRLAVAAGTVAALSPDPTIDDLARVAAVTVSPRVAAAHDRVVAAVRTRCHLDPVTGRIADGA